MKIVRWPLSKSKFTRWHELAGYRQTACGKPVPKECEVFEGTNIRRDKLKGTPCNKCFE